MRSVPIRVVAMSGLALLASPGNAAAQVSSSGVLNVVEVRQLVARAEPGDHARLGVHFAACTRK